GSEVARRSLATRLTQAGCAVNDAGTDWLRAGDFSAAIIANNAPARSEPNRRIWRGGTVMGTRRLSVDVFPWPGNAKWQWVRIRVSSIDPVSSPLTGIVKFKLHSSYPDPEQDVPVMNGEAVLLVPTEGPYKLRAECGETLTFDLKDITGVDWW